LRCLSSSISALHVWRIERSSAIRQPFAFNQPTAHVTHLQSERQHSPCRGHRGGLNMRASPHVALMPPMPPRGRQVDVGGSVAAVLLPSLPPLKQAVSLILRQWRPASARWPASAWQTSSRGRAARAAWSLRCRAACAAGTPPDCRAGARPGCGADTQPKPARPLRAAWRSGCGSSGYRGANCRDLPLRQHAGRPGWLQPYTVSDLHLRCMYDPAVMARTAVLNARDTRIGAVYLCAAIPLRKRLDFANAHV